MTNALNCSWRCIVEKLPLRKQLLIIKLFFNGFSYDEIATKANVSKGSVSNVISDLKAGRFPEAGDIPEQTELLRELAVDLKQSRLTPGQAAVGVIALSRFHEFGLEPADLQRFASVCHTLTPDVGVQDFIRAVLSIDEVQKRTGLDIDALEKKAQELEKSVVELEPLAQQAAEYREQVEGLASQRHRGYVQNVGLRCSGSGRVKTHIPKMWVGKEAVRCDTS